MHLRLFYARALTQRLMYDEALALFSRIDPARVVDPATCLFYQAVCQHNCSRKQKGWRRSTSSCTGPREWPNRTRASRP